MINKASRAEIREKKHRRIRHHLNGTATTPRLAVFRSNKHMYAQIIDDTVGKTLVSASTLQLLKLASKALFSTEEAISITVK